MNKIIKKKKHIILLGENCSEKFLLAKKLIKHSDFVLKNRSGKEVGDYLEYYDSEKVYTRNISDNELADQDKLMQSVTGCETVILFGAHTIHKSIVSCMESCGVKTLIYSIGIDPIQNRENNNQSSSARLPIGNGDDVDFEGEKTDYNHSPLDMIIIEPQEVNGKPIDKQISLSIQLNKNQKKVQWGIPIFYPFQFKEARYELSRGVGSQNIEEFEKTPYPTIYSDVYSTVCLSMLARLDHKPIKTAWYI